MRGPSYSVPHTRRNLDYTQDTSNRPCLLMCARSSNQVCSKVSFGATIGTYLRSAHEQTLPATSATSVLTQTKQEKSQLIPPSQSPVTGESPRFSSTKIKWDQSSMGLKSKKNCSRMTHIQKPTVGGYGAANASWLSMILRHKTRQSTAEMLYKFQASQQYGPGKGVLTVRKDKTFSWLADDNSVKITQEHQTKKSRRRNFYHYL